MALALTARKVGFTDVSPRIPTWVANLPLWHWYAIPSTALVNVEPRPLPLGNPESKIIAWCGAALKRKGSVYLVGPSGGHGDYAGNEVDALRLNDENPRWVELHAPTPHDHIISDTPYYLDKRPASIHTYWQSQFIEQRNRLFILPTGGISWSAFSQPPAGWPYTYEAGYSCSFNLTSNEWDPPEYVARYTGGGKPFGCLVAKHPLTGDVYYFRYNAGWWRWTQATNEWVNLHATGYNPDNYAGAAIDPLRKRMLIVGSTSPMVRDLNGKLLDVTFTGLGAAALKATYPGVMYDEANDVFLVMFNSGTTIRVLRVHAESWWVDEPAITGGSLSKRINGIFNSAQYVPELKGVVIAHEYRGNVKFMRTAM
ncbi:MAG: hypothetical protein HY308_14295 [Gammaproteobacteria bacterium]|nr:hypothetical protein [Gammaproteobacteria bacterium]